MNRLKHFLFIFFVGRFFFDVNAMEVNVNEPTVDDQFFNLFSMWHKIKFNDCEKSIIRTIFSKNFDENIFKNTDRDHIAEIVCTAFAAGVYLDKGDIVGARLFESEELGRIIQNGFWSKDKEIIIKCRNIFIATLEMALALKHMHFLFSFFKNVFCNIQNTTDIFFIRCKEVVDEFLYILEYSPVKLKLEERTKIKAEIEDFIKTQSNLNEIIGEEIFQVEDLD